MKGSAVFIITFLLFITDLNRCLSEKQQNTTIISNLPTDDLPIPNLQIPNLPNKGLKVVSITKVANGLTIKSDEHISNESTITKEISKTLLNKQLNKQQKQQQSKELNEKLLKKKLLNVTVPAKTQLNTTDSPIKKVDECSKFKFDYLVLSLYWPVNICAKKACILNSPQRWFIYHLSPGMQNNQFLAQCCAKRPFNTSELGNIVTNELKEHMQSVLATKPDEVFWNEEWLNQGGCFKYNDRLNTINKYFSETVRLFKEINLEQWLKEKNIAPQNDTNKIFKFDDFYNAIYEKRPFKFQIKCNLSKQITDSSIIDDVNFCLDKDLNKINCPATMSTKSNCNEKIIYPTLEADLADKVL